MTFENNSILQKWHMTSTSPKQDKCDDTHKKLCFTNIAHFAKKSPKLFAKG